MTTSLSFRTLSEKLSLLEEQGKGGHPFDTKAILLRQLAFLEKAMLPAAVSSLVIGVIFLSIIAPRADTVVLAVWYACLVLAVVPRFFLSLLRTRFSFEKKPYFWLGICITSFSLSGVVWGSSLIFAQEPEPAANFYLVLAMLAGLGCVAVIAGAAHKFVIWAFLGAISLPTLGFIFATPYVPSLAMGLSVVIYVLVIGYCGHLVNDLLVKTLTLQYKNQKLNHEISALLNDHYESLESLRFLVNRMGSGVAMFDQKNNLVTWNKAYEDIFGYPKDFLQPGVPLRELLEWYLSRFDKNKVEIKAEIAKILEKLDRGRKKKFLNTEFDLPDGRIYDLRIDYLPDGETIYSFSDVTHRAKASTDALVKMTQLDPLTSMPNRLMFRRELKKRLLRSETTGRPIAILLVNIDTFKTINEMYGHATGDRVIVQMGEKLCSLAEQDDFVARFGGDEFAVITQRLTTKDKVLEYARQVQNSFRQPMKLGGKEIILELSIGATLYPDDQGSPDQLVRNAGIALGKAKQEGGTAIVMFNWHMQEELKDKTTLVTDIRTSMETSQFVLHYQPQIDLKSRQICGVEALMRWNHPQRGWISPGEFIPLAEWSKQIIPLTEQLLPEACIQAQVWAAQRIKPVPISVNISPMHFHDKGFVDFVRECLEEASLAPELLELEITEGIVMSKTEDVMSTLRGLSELGVRLSIDDFGTGYSSLTYLRRLPISKLKIDQAFVRDMIQEKEAQSVIEAIIRLGHSFNLEVIAEGIETAEQLKMLAAMNCDQAQGFYIGRPLSAADITEWIRTHSG
tara:strand:- start:8848 stop:11232 length:2385 start_codon:yes stop_codon:yes gene_type:complete